MMIDPIISKNVALIKDANGKDIERIYDKYGNLVFKNWNTLEGPLPIECFTSSNKLRNYRIYGNTIKDGTPEPENPVEVQGCGEQTENLFDCDIEQGTISAEGKPRVADSRVRANGFITLDVGTYTLNAVANLALDTFIFKYKMDGTFEERIPLEWTQMPYTFNTSERQMIKIVFAKHPANNSYKIEPEEVSDIMLNTGSTALPYEPYGYKIPVMVAEQPHILFTETFDGLVRREASWSIKNGIVSVTGTATGQSNPISAMENRAGMSGDFLITKNNENSRISVSCLIVKDDITSYADLTSILHLDGTETRVAFFPQVQAGTYNNTCTPTIQQVITTPVYIGSEPLHKIGDYADHVDFKRGVVVRRIKKLVLTGEEPWNGYSNAASGVGVFVGIPAMLVNSRINGFCTHFRSQFTPVGSTINGITFGASNDTLYITFSVKTTEALNLTNTASVKTWLAAQYSAGTPVTIWYALAEPEEEILPLSQKIPTNIGSNTFSCTISPAPSKAMIQYKKK